jgi:predicted amidohydrolase
MYMNQVVQVHMDHDATVEKACRLVAEATQNGARLVVFTETFVKV